MVDSFSLTPNMLRVVVQSDEFKQLQNTDLGGYIKLLFHLTGHTNINQLGSGERPVMRTYTISQLNKEKGEISIDFVQHHNEKVRLHTINPQQGGYAISWAIQTKAGDTISIGGPGNSQHLDVNNNPFLLIPVIIEDA